MSTVLTDYRYITQTPEVCGGRPIIRGTRTAVQTIVGYYKLGLNVEEMLEGLPHLTAAQIYEALSYYHDHLTEIESDLVANQTANVLAQHGLTVALDGRIVLP